MGGPCPAAASKGGGKQLHVAFGDPLTKDPDTVIGPDYLSFIDVEPTRYRIYPVVSHIAEKLHAYTFEWEDRENTRLRDLPDIGLLAQSTEIIATELNEAIQETFEHRATHAPPEELAAPPDSWASRYDVLVDDEDLPWPTLEALFEQVKAFVDPALDGTEATWNPTTWSWTG